MLFALLQLVLGGVEFEHEALLLFGHVEDGAVVVGVQLGDRAQVGFLRPRIGRSVGLHELPEARDLLFEPLLEHGVDGLVTLHELLPADQARERAPLAAGEPQVGLELDLVVDGRVVGLPRSAVEGVGGLDLQDARRVLVLRRDEPVGRSHEEGQALVLEQSRRVLEHAARLVGVPVGDDRFEALACDDPGLVADVLGLDLAGEFHPQFEGSAPSVTESIGHARRGELAGASSFPLGAPDRGVGENLHGSYLQERIRTRSTSAAIHSKRTTLGVCRSLTTAPCSKARNHPRG